MTAQALKKRKAFKTFISLAVIFFANTAFSEALYVKAMTNDDLILQAQTDGALFTQASFCQYAEKDMIALMEKQIKHTLELAQNNKLDFNFAAWKAAAEPSMDEMTDFLNKMTRSGENYEKNCAEIKTEVDEKLAQKSP